MTRHTLPESQCCQHTAPGSNPEALTQEHAECSEDLVCIGPLDILGAGPSRLGGVPHPRVLVSNRQDDAEHDDGSQHHRGIHSMRHLHHAGSCESYSVVSAVSVAESAAMCAYSLQLLQK